MITIYNLALIINVVDNYLKIVLNLKFFRQKFSIIIAAKKKRIKIRESVDEEPVNYEEQGTIDPLKVKPETPSQKEVINYIKTNPECGFLYMMYAVPPQNVYFTPYYLK